MNNKGFTLVELLAMLLVLGILMAISIPNITGILANNKLNVMKADATKMIDTAKIKFSSLRPSEKPKVNECVVFALNALNDSDDISTGPNGGEYLQYESFIVIVREANKYEYYIRLVEKKGSQKLGMDLVKRDVISSGNTNYIKTITTEYGLDSNEGAGQDTLNSNAAFKSATGCSGGVIEYYPGRALT